MSLIGKLFGWSIRFRESVTVAHESAQNLIKIDIWAVCDECRDFIMGESEQRDRSAHRKTVNTNFPGQGLWLLAGNRQRGDQVVDLGCSAAGEDALTTAVPTKVKQHHIIPQGVLQRCEWTQVHTCSSISMTNHHRWCRLRLRPEIASKPWTIRCAKGERATA